MSKAMSDARRKYWQNIPKEKRIEHGTRMIKIRWMRTTPEMRKQFINRITAKGKQNAKSKKF
jgi:hypothetical protein